MILIAWSGIC